MRRGSQEADAAAPSGDPAPYAPTLGLALALGLGALLALAPAIRLALPATELPAPFPPQHQDAETLVFVLAFALILPLAALGGRRLGAALGRVAGPSRLSSAAAVALAGTFLVVLGARGAAAIGLGGALGWLGALAIVWWVYAATVFARLLAGSAVPLPPPPRAWAAAGLAAVAAALACVDLAGLAVAPLVAGMALAGALAAAASRGRLELPRLGRGWGTLVDLSVVVLVIVAATGLEVISPEDPEAAFQTSILQFHQNFFLGPANQVLHGDAMLVDTFSQYGVGAIYAIAGWSKLVGIGNGTLGLLDGLGGAIVLAAGYGILRLGGVSRPLAAGAIGVAVVALIYGLAYPVGGLLQHGAIRFGLPIAVLLGAVIEARRPGAAGRVVALVALGIASIWALEAFGYALLTLGAVVAARVATTAPGHRRDEAVRWLLGAIGACLVAHLLLAGLTLIAAGELPDWGRYASTLRAFLSGDIGDLTYDFAAWSPAFLVAILLFSSALGIGLLVAMRPHAASAHRAAVIAIAGATGYGIALFSYFVNRSAEHILPYICLPAVLAVALWLGLGCRLVTAPRWRALGLGAATAAATLMVATAWPGAGERFSESALAHAAPGGESPADAVERLGELPPIKTAAPEGVRLLRTLMPAEERSVVLTDADLAIEILWRADRAFELPFGDPWEDSFVAEQHAGEMRDSVAALAPGDRILIDEPGLAAFRGYLADPARDPISDPFGSQALIPTGVASLQELALKEIGIRFRLREIAAGAHGLRVVELVPRRS